MDDFDRDSNASSDNEQQDQDDTVTNDGEGDDMDVDDRDDQEEDQDNEEEEEDQDQDQEDAEQEAAEQEAEQEQLEREEASANDDNNATEGTSVTLDGPKYVSGAPRLRPTLRPEAITAQLYDIVPTMAAPQSTSINAIAITPDLRYWITGGSDGYIRKYDGPGTINGKQLLTVAQRHPFVDSVVKAGILMSYWENKEDTKSTSRGTTVIDDSLSPVYSLAVHNQALWLLSGLESGSINLWSVRHDEGKIITSLGRDPKTSVQTESHTNAVSVLTLSPDETSVLSGSWDKQIFDWDLNTGMIIRDFKGSGGQISAIELRPLSGAPIPPEAGEEPVYPSDTFGSNNARPLPNGAYTNGFGGGPVNGVAAPMADPVGDAPGSEHESLFGSPGGSLFGDDNNMGGGGGANAFGDDNDNLAEDAMLTMPGEGLEATEGAAGDTHMADATLPDTDFAPAPAVQPPPDAAQGPNGDAPADGPQQFFDAPQHQPPADGTQPDQDQQPQPPYSSQPAPAASQSPTLVHHQPPASTAGHDPNATSPHTFFSAAMDGTIRFWDRRVPNPVARIGNRPGVPPWCMGACWSPDGNNIYAGRRNGTVEEFSVHHARGGHSAWTPERVLRFPAGSGAVSAVRPMPNGRHLVCASHDILRLYDLGDTRAQRGHSSVPFLIIPGPPRAGVISTLYVDPTARFMITAAGTRGWEGTTTECLIGYEIGCTG